MGILASSPLSSLLLQFPVASKGGVPTVIELVVSYDPASTRGTRTHFRSLDQEPVPEMIGRFGDQVDEVVRRAGPIAAVGWVHAQLRPL
jgi:hypothetical protein